MTKIVEFYSRELKRLADSDAEDKKTIKNSDL